MCTISYAFLVHTDDRQRAQRAHVVDELFRPLPAPHLLESPTSRHIAVLHFFLRSRQEFEHKLSIGAADGSTRPTAVWDVYHSVATANCSVLIKE